MKKAPHFFLKNVFTFLILVSLHISCGEDQEPMINDCERSIDSYLTEAEKITPNPNIEACLRNAEFSINLNSRFANPVFNPNDENTFAIIRLNPFSEEFGDGDLVVVYLCSGTETILDSGTFGNFSLKWTTDDWIYYTRGRDYFRIKSNATGLEKIDVPNAKSNPVWNDKGDMILYIKQQFLSQQIMIADQNFEPIDSLDSYRFAGPYEWISNNEFVYSFVDDSEDMTAETLPRGLYTYNLDSKESDNIYNFENFTFLKCLNTTYDSEFVYWMSSRDMYQTEINTGITTKIVNSNFDRTFDWIAKSPTSDYIMSIRSDLEEFNECKGNSRSELTLIDLNTNAIMNVDYD